MDTRLKRRPSYYGQFFLPLALTFSSNSTRLIHTLSLVPSVSTFLVYRTIFVTQHLIS